MNISNGFDDAPLLELSGFACVSEKPENPELENCAPNISFCVAVDPVSVAKFANGSLAIFGSVGNFGADIVFCPKDPHPDGSLNGAVLLGAGLGAGLEDTELVAAVSNKLLKAVF